MEFTEEDKQELDRRLFELVESFEEKYKVAVTQIHIGHFGNSRGVVLTRLESVVVEYVIGSFPSCHQ